MSFLRSKHSGWTYEGTRTPFFGGGGGGGPNTTQSTGTTYNTNIPEYAQPYVENMLGATQKQLFTMGGGTPEVTTQIGTDADGNPIMQTTPATGDQITGFKPYKPYSTNVNDYVAGFSPMQQQAMQATGQLGVPSQYGQASRMTGQAGMGSLGLAGQMAGAGQQYAQQAQDPNAIAGYMSPYMQNVVDYQKSQALRDYNLGTGVRKAQATGANAFGGNRQALMEAEAQRSLGNQLQGITAQGSQQAFQNAQQAQQYGANLGLQGQQGALQGLGQYGQMAGQLGQLGGQELAARQGIIQSQYGMGQQQQAMEQQKINQAMQDWANTQQYPLMQLGVMSNMLRGLPMQASTTNQYQAAPNALTQGIGAAGAGASLYNALKGGKEGGLPSEFKSTGIKSYYEGDVVESTKSDLYDLPLEELDKRAKSSTSPTIKRLASAIAKEKRMGLAGGGIIAFANPNEENNQGVVKEEQQRAEDRKVIERGFSDAKSGWENTKAAARDILTLPGRGIAGAFESAVTRPARAMGVDIPYLPSSFYGGDASSLTPHMDALKKQRQSQTTPVEAAPTETKSDPNADLPPMPTNVKLDDKGRADAAKQGPNTNAGIKAAAPSTGVGIKPNTGIAPNIGGIKGPTNLPAGLEAPVDPDANKTIAQLAAEKAAYMGPDVGAQEARKTAMAERASAKDEARRAQSMRMAEFFAAWGSTPGSTISAGLTALKNKAPDFIADAKEEAKIRRAINKDIAELDKIERLEKSGNYDEAAKRKKDLAKNALDTWGKKVDYLSARESDASRIKAAEIGAASRVEAAGSKGSGGYKTIQEAENALSKHFKDNNDPGSTYLGAKTNVVNRKADYEAGKLDEKAKARYEDSLEKVKEYETRRKELKANVEFFKQNKGMTTSSGSSSESSGVDLNNFWKQ
jgi:hypothetical protein